MHIYVQCSWHHDIKHATWEFRWMEHRMGFNWYFPCSSTQSWNETPLEKRDTLESLEFLKKNTPKFNGSPLKNDGWKITFLLGRLIFRGELLNFRWVFWIIFSPSLWTPGILTSLFSMFFPTTWPPGTIGFLTAASADARKKKQGQIQQWKCLDLPFDGWNPKQPPGMVLKPYKWWDKLPINTKPGTNERSLAPGTWKKPNGIFYKQTWLPFL